MCESTLLDLVTGAGAIGVVLAAISLALKEDRFDHHDGQSGSESNWEPRG